MSTHFKYFNRIINYEVQENGCWNCIGRMTSRGYPIFSFNFKTYAVHRLVFIIEKNDGKELPKGIVVRHTCDNTICINPDHLISGTHKDNMQDKVKRGRWRGPSKWKIK